MALTIAVEVAALEPGVCLNRRLNNGIVAVLLNEKSGGAVHVDPIHDEQLGKVLRSRE